MTIDEQETLTGAKRLSPLDQWAICRLGHVHWGLHGGAGLLLRHAPAKGEPVYLLQFRSAWVDQRSTWGVPGGAIHKGESPETAARREAAEEIGPLPPCRVTDIDVQDCGGGWKFHTVTADVDRPFDAYCQQETDAVGWFTRQEMRGLPLHPGFRQWVDDHEPKPS
jgi:8-oxo-dGTP pyrophosphatase MutT (NUDIX family)